MRHIEIENRDEPAQRVAVNGISPRKNYNVDGGVWVRLASKFHLLTLGRRRVRSADRTYPVS